MKTKAQMMMENLKNGKVLNYKDLEVRQYKMSNGELYYRDGECGWNLSQADAEYLINNYFHKLEVAN